MTMLHSLQDQFQGYLLKNQTDFESEVLSTKEIPAVTRLAIYKNAYRSRLTEALESSYPVLAACMGAELFEKMASDYIDHYPSHNRSIRWFGDCLATYFNTQDEYQAFPYLSELAQFEWTQTLVFDAADSAIIQMEDMAKIPPESWTHMQLRAHPSLHRLDLSWNIVAIWQAITENQTPPDPEKNPSPIAWVLWRHHFINRFCSVSQEEAWAIDAIMQAYTFSEMCEGLCQWVKEEEAGLHAASLLKGWIQSALIAKVMIE